MLLRIILLTRYPAEQQLKPFPSSNTFTQTPNSHIQWSRKEENKIIADKCYSATGTPTYNLSLNVFFERSLPEFTNILYLHIASLILPSAGRTQSTLTQKAV